MLDINFIRSNPDKVKEAIVNKHEKADVDALLTLDEKRRSLLFDRDNLRQNLNRTSKEIGRLKKEKQDASELIAEMGEVSDKIKQYESDLRELDEQVNEVLIRIPNVPADDVPVGEAPGSNVEIRHWGEGKELDFKPFPHWDLGKALDILDFERASKLSGSGFALFKGAAARLERALYNFMLDLHTSEHGYTEVFPPFLANRACMTGTGQLPKLEEDMYRTSADDLFLIPTAEVPLTNIHAGEILSCEDLPIYYTAYTACFRREAGAYGKDTRGLIRVHQFDKVEMVKFVLPETSYDELESLTQNAERVLQLLGLQYRVIKLCTGDLSFAAAKCYDLESYAPGIDRWLEVSSCSNFEDFQARRCNIRFRDENKKVRFVHTLNGSGLALARIILTIIETYQKKDGSIEIPHALRPYMGGMEVIEPKKA